MSDSPGPKLVASVRKALELLNLVEAEGDGLGISELARRAGLPKSTAYRLLHTLATERALIGVDGRYRIGPRVTDDLSIPASDTIDRVQRVVTPFLAALFEQTRLTAHLAALVGTEIVFLNKLHGMQRVLSPSRIGGRAPVHCTSLGKAMLAFEPEVLEKVCSHELPRWTAHTITDPDVLRMHVMAIRRSRVSLDRAEFVEGVGSLASVVTGPAGEPVAALAVTGPLEEVHRGRFDSVVLEVCARAGAAYRKAVAADA